MPVAVDTGPLVALLNQRDAHHDWARLVLAGVETPLLTCEAVLAEASYLLRDVSGGYAGVLELVTRGAVALPFRLRDEIEEVRTLMARYTSVPMPLADACLVRMAELDASVSVLTLDSDFHVYRKRGRRVVPLYAQVPKRR